MPIPKAHNTVEVSEIPLCDLRHLQSFGPCDQTAYADAKLSPEFNGIWGNVCRSHFRYCNCELGAGRGQKFVKVER